LLKLKCLANMWKTTCSDPYSYGPLLHRGRSRGNLGAVHAGEPGEWGGTPLKSGEALMCFGVGTIRRLLSHLYSKELERPMESSRCRGDSNKKGGR
jgi:hypothetical protein